MPKAAPNQVIIHRIEFQESEREMLRQVTAGYTFRNVTRGVFNLTSDLTTVVILIIIYEWLTDRTILDEGVLAALGLGTKDLAAALAESWANYRQSQEYSEDYHQRATSVAGGLRNLLDNIIGLFTGEYIQRVQEYQEAQDSSSGGGGGF